MRNKTKSLFGADETKPETQPLFSDWRYDLPNEETGWRRAEKQGLFDLKEITLEQQAEAERAWQLAKEKGLV